MYHIYSMQIVFMGFSLLYVVLPFTEVNCSETSSLLTITEIFFAILVDLLLRLVSSTTHEKHHILCKCQANLSGVSLP